MTGWIESRQIGFLALTHMEWNFGAFFTVSSHSKVTSAQADQHLFRLLPQYRKVSLVAI